MSHTPGPWTMRTVSTSAGVCHRVYPEAWGDPPSHGAICLYDDQTSLNPHPDGEQIANARLIAAAPEMLEALEELVDIEGPLPGTANWHAKVMAVIAKARGGHHA